MPLSWLWRKVDAMHLTPAPAIWLPVGVALLIAVCGGAYSVVTSMSTVGLYVAYILPVFLGWRARKAKVWTQRGPWHLGPYSNVVNLVAVLWTVFIICHPGDASQSVGRKSDARRLRPARGLVLALRAPPLPWPKPAPSLEAPLVALRLFLVA